MEIGHFQDACLLHKNIVFEIGTLMTLDPPADFLRKCTVKTLEVDL